MSSRRAKQLADENVSGEGLPLVAVAESQRVLGYQGGYSAAGPGMVDLRDPLVMLDKVRFGYDVNAPGMPRLDINPEPLRSKKENGKGRA